MAAIANTTTDAQHENADLAADQVQVASSFAKMISAIDGQPSGAGAIAALIEAHRTAYRAFVQACDDEEKASVALHDAFKGQLYKGAFASSYEMERGVTWVREQVSTEIAWHREKFKALSLVDPDAHAVALKAINDCEIKHIAEIGMLFRSEQDKFEVVQDRYDELSDVEQQALEHVCSFKCATAAESQAKGEYLSEIRGCLYDKHLVYLIKSLMTAI